MSNVVNEIETIVGRIMFRIMGVDKFIPDGECEIVDRICKKYSVSKTQMMLLHDRRSCAARHEIAFNLSNAGMRNAEIAKFLKTTTRNVTKFIAKHVEKLSRVVEGI